jgi:Spy/CpxP family protein refolding chaperone
MRNVVVAPFVRKAAVALALCVLAVWCTQALAQAGPGGPSLDPEKVKTAWEMEAKTVAKTLGLNDEQTGKLVVAYKSARDAQDKKREEMRAEQGEGRRPNRRAMMEAEQKLNQEFEEVLKGFLTGEQAVNAAGQLNAYTRRADVMVATLEGMELTEETLTKALGAVAHYVVESDKLLKKAMETSDFQSVRDKMREERVKLDTGIAEMLTPEQIAQWRAATSMRRIPGMPETPPTPPAPPTQPAE